MSASGFITSPHIRTKQLYISGGFGVGQTTIGSTFVVGDMLEVDGNANVKGNIKATGNLSSSNITTDAITAASLTLSRDIKSAPATDAAFYTINGSRGEIRSQLQSAVAADTGFTLELRNTSVQANSLIVTNVIGGEGAIVTGSVVSANVVAANTASINFFNIGAAIVNDAKFTASFAIL